MLARNNLQIPFIIILGIVFTYTLFYANQRFSTQNPGGNDFVPRWIGTREFIQTGASPYSEETTAKIQEFFYQGPATGDEDWQLFIYPFYSMLIFAPFSLVEEFTLARSLWMTVLEIAIIATVLISARLMDGKPKLYLIGSLLVFWLVGYHGARPIINGNASIIVGLFIILTLLSIQKGWDKTAGIFLAISSIKPQVVILLVPLILIWAVSRKRSGLLISFLLSMIALVGGSMLFQPDWLIQDIIQVLQYPFYTEPGSPGQIFLLWWPGVGRQLGIGLTILVSAVLLWEWAGVWKKGFMWLFWTACLTLTITNLIGVRTATANFAALIPATVLIFMAWERRRGDNVKTGGLAVLIGLMIGLWVLFITTVEIGAGGQPIQSPILYFPFPFVILLGLYWVRWWVVRLPESNNAVHSINRLRQ